MDFNWKVLSIIIVPWLVIGLLWIRRKRKEKKMADMEKEIVLSYSPIPNDPRLQEYAPIFMLEDVFELRVANNIGLNPKFEAKKKLLTPGRIVKLSFQILEVDENGNYIDENVSNENMWVIVEKRDGDMFYGILDNDPYASTTLTSGYKFWFHANHILDID